VTRIYDLTLPISGRLPSWPGDPNFKLEAVSSTNSGEEFSVSALHMGTHTGAHASCSPGLERTYSTQSSPSSTSTFGECIRKARLRKGLTQKELAEMVGVNGQNGGQLGAVQNRATEAGRETGSSVRDVGSRSVGDEEVLSLEWPLEPE